MHLSLKFVLFSVAIFLLTTVSSGAAWRLRRSDEHDLTEEMDSIFAALDGNGDGLITKAEYFQAVEELDILDADVDEAFKEEIDLGEIFDQNDVNKDGAIDMAEFVHSGRG